MFGINIRRVFNDDDLMLNALMNTEIEDDDGNRYKVIRGFNSEDDWDGEELVVAQAYMINGDVDEYGRTEVYDIMWLVYVDYDGISMSGLCDWKHPWKVEEAGKMIYLREWVV